MLTDADIIPPELELALAEAAYAPSAELLLTAHDRAVTVDFSSDEKMLASGGEDGDIHLWSIPDGERIRSFKGHEGAVGAVRFTRDGRQLISAAEGESPVRIWDVATGNQVDTLDGLQPSSGAKPSWDLDIDEDDNYVVACDGRTGAVGLWSLKTRSVIWTKDSMPQWLNCLLTDSEGTVLLTSLSGALKIDRESASEEPIDGMVQSDRIRG